MGAAGRKVIIFIVFSLFASISHASLPQLCLLPGDTLDLPIIEFPLYQPPGSVPEQLTSPNFVCARDCLSETQADYSLPLNLETRIGVSFFPATTSFSFETVVNEFLDDQYFSIVTIRAIAPTHSPIKIYTSINIRNFYILHDAQMIEVRTVERLDECYK